MVAKRLAVWDTGTAVNLMCVPPDSCAEALTPNVMDVMVYGVGPLGGARVR